jgi:hypothetical protein
MAERRRKRRKRPAIQVAAVNRSHCAAEVRAEQTADQTAETRRAQRGKAATEFVDVRWHGEHNEDGG